jgi:hypothetical protein
MVAKAVKHQLEEHNLLRLEENPTLDFYVSDLTDSFAGSAKYFFPSGLELQKLDIWNP